MRPVLYVGNKNYSSWSLRPWLALRWSGLDFDTKVVRLGGEGYGQSRIPEVLAVSPSGRVPVLHVGDVAIWDSLAICEWAAEARPEAKLWPADAGLRGVARSAVAEMHSSFSAVRRDLSMNIRRRVPAQAWPEDTAADIARLLQLWTQLRETHGARGPWLFGERTVADAFYAPVVTRFRTYGVALPEVAAAYSQTVLTDPDFLSWEKDGIAEPWSIAQTDALYSQGRSA